MKLCQIAPDDNEVEVNDNYTVDDNDETDDEAFHMSFSSIYRTVGFDLCAA